MSAGHPNDASPFNLRNIGFAIHVGGDDTAYDRNAVALEWGEMLDTLQSADPEGYPHQVEVHPGLPQWMELANQVSIPFVQGFERNGTPTRVVWRQVNVFHGRFYWLGVDAPQTEHGDEIVARIETQTFFVDSGDVAEVSLRMTDDMVDMDLPVTVTANGDTVFEGEVRRTIGVIFKTLKEREDPGMVYIGEVTIPL